MNKKNIIIVIVSIFIIAQFVRPEKNVSGDNTNSIHKKYALPTDVEATLKVACDDCHSNTTIYPWYAEVQPIATWIQKHVDNGKKHLNFSILGSKPVWLQYHKMEEVQEMIEKNEMPLNSYTWIHGDAKLSSAQKEAIVNWSKTVRDSMKAHYPADSLVRPKKK